MKTTKYRLERVHYMPKDLEPGVLYVSQEFGTAAHLCPCGCGSKIRTPLGPTEWSLSGTRNSPTLYPSIGNWQLPCKSHYWMREGQVIWAREWTREQIEAGRRAEGLRRKAYYNAVESHSRRPLTRFWNWLRSFLGR